MGDDRTIFASAEVFNSSPGANINILSTALTPKKPVSAFRITVSLTGASIFNVMITQGVTTFGCGVNANQALTAEGIYTFVIGVRNTFTYNFQIETATVVRYLLVEEVAGGVI